MGSDWNYCISQQKYQMKRPFMVQTASAAIIAHRNLFIVCINKMSTASEAKFKQASNYYERVLNLTKKMFMITKQDGGARGGV